MQITKLTINTDVILTEAISDYLIGVLGAAVEYRVDDERSAQAIHAFIMVDSGQDQERRDLEAEIIKYTDEMAAIFRVEKPTVTSEVVADQDWAKNWKEYFKPFEILEGLVIVPSWEPYRIKGNEAVIVMDPGMAFGTGHHATTRLCLQLIRSGQDGFHDRRVLDVGTGTGILGMAAALWGAAEVLGIDNDDAAVAAAGHNVGRNRLQDRMSVSRQPLAEVSGCYSLVVANIVHDVLIELAEDLERVTSPGGRLILSGLMYGDQTHSIRKCFLGLGFRLLREKQEGDWGALAFEKRRGHSGPQA